MTPEQLEAIRQRVAAATTGPWVPAVVAGDWYVLNSEDDYIAEPYTGNDEADARFIANARQDIPALLTLLDRKDAALAAMRAELREQDRQLARQAARHQRQVDELERTIERLKEGAE